MFLRTERHNTFAEHPNDAVQALDRAARAYGVGRKPLRTCSDPCRQIRDVVVNLNTHRSNRSRDALTPQHHRGPPLPPSTAFSCIQVTGHWHVAQPFSFFTHAAPLFFTHAALLFLYTPHDCFFLIVTHGAAFFFTRGAAFFFTRGAAFFFTHDTLLFSLHESSYGHVTDRHTPHY